MRRVCWVAAVILSGFGSARVFKSGGGRMRPVPRLLGFVFVIGASACADRPTDPSSFVRLELVVPSGIAPGESRPLVARLIRADTSVKDVTTQARWAQKTGAETAILTVTATGPTATGIRPGSSLVSASVGDFTAEGEVLVLPPGTFRLIGQVTDQRAPLPDVTVSVTTGAGEGLTVRTDAAGAYALYGVAGRVHIRARKDGYFDKTEPIDVAAHSSLAFEMKPFEPTEDYSGVYTLFITANHCTPGYPEFAKARVYTARLEQSGPSLVVALSDFVGAARFTGVMEPDGDLTFSIRPLTVWDDFEFDFVERFPDRSWLIVGGVVVARGTAAGITRKPLVTSLELNAYTRLDNSNEGCYLERFELLRR